MYWKMFVFPDVLSVIMDPVFYFWKLNLIKVFTSNFITELKKLHAAAQLHCTKTSVEPADL